MARNGHGVILRQVRTLFNTGSSGGLTDRQLLERFRARGGDAAEQAFAALVERHGPMVLRVCRRTLRDPHDAQDAFQATFLVLVRKAGSLWSHDSIGPWLHAVACRVSACARASEARRRAHERRAAEAAILFSPEEGPAWDDLGQVLHEEISRLPERFRAAVVLCDLEGLTQEQAARQLGWPAGTVRSRLARGRDRLHARLTRRGLAPSAGALAGLLAAESARAGVPATLASATVRTATLLAAGQAATGAVAVSASALTDGVLRAMLVTKLKLATAALLTVGVGTGGSVVLAFQQAGGQAAGPQVEAGAPREVGPPGVGDAPGEEKGREPSEPPANPELKLADSEIALAKAELKHAEDRLDWSDKMLAKGYVSLGQNNADKLAVQRAKFALEQALAKKKAMEKYSGDETTTRLRLEERDTLSEIALARAELKRAEDRLDWSDKMLAKGYVSVGQNNSDKLAVQRAKFALEKALAKKALEKYSGDERDRAPSARRADLDLEAVKGEIAQARSEVKLAEAQLEWTKAQLDWAERRFAKGFVSKGQVGSEALAVQRAKVALEQARLKEVVLRQDEGRKPGPEEGEQRIVALENELMATQKMRTRAGARVSSAVGAVSVSLNSKTPGILGEMDLKKAEAEVVSARANVAHLHAEVQYLELRLSRAKTPLPADQQDVALLEAQLEVLRAGLRNEEARLEMAKAELVVNALRRARTPGSVSDADSKKAEKALASAADDCDRYRAEIRELELRLSQAKQERDGAAP
jgi:RNA polymerase sigma factor (sigma-70 family)